MQLKTKKTVAGKLAGTAAAFLLCCAAALFASCDYWGEDWYKNGESENQPQAYTAVTATEVTTDYVSGKTFTISIDGESTDFTIRFADGGKTGTVTRGSETGTASYDGDVLTITVSGETFYGWLRQISGTYYFSVNRLKKENGSAGLYGKWVWESGRPLGAVSALTYYSDGRAQREDDGRWATWTCDGNGIMRYWWEETGVETGDSGRIVYTGNYIYAMDFLFTPKA